VLHEDKDRRVVPRWRAFSCTAKLGEIAASITKAPSISLHDAAFEEKLTDWAKHKTFSFAADVVSAAIVLGREAQAADAAHYVLSSRTPGCAAARKLASRVVGEADVDDQEMSDLDPLDPCVVGRQIHSLRRRLHDEPRNAFLWVDMARLYESLAMVRQAEAAIQKGLWLAPNERFVLRSASRLLLHHGRHRDAHDLLQKCDRIRSDPWLLAAEIAVASAAGRVSRPIKTAMKLSVSEAFSPFHLSELASALGTLELDSGNRKKGRRLLEQSLVEPTENALAQATWLQRKTGALVVLPATLDTLVAAHEARAWSWYRAEEWRKAILEARYWLADQPFSSRPAVLGSYLAATALRDFQMSAHMADLGLQANPNDFLLLNNAAFARAQMNDVEGAKKILERINSSTLSAEHYPVKLATCGLVAYRSGNTSSGREMYLKAIALAERQSNEHHIVLRARLYLAMEELRIASSYAEEYRKSALDLARSVSQPDIALLVERLKTVEPGMD
jgi:hypothetical protein